MPQDKQPVRICFDRVVPASFHPVSATATRISTANYIAAVQQKSSTAAAAPPRTAALFKHLDAIQKLGTLNAADPVAVARMALIDLKKWENARTLRCHFLDGDDLQKGKVKDKASIWSDYANVTFDFVDDPAAEIRISFQADTGSWSAIGTDCLITDYFPQYQPTMNFELWVASRRYPRRRIRARCSPRVRTRPRVYPRTSAAERKPEVEGGCRLRRILRAAQLLEQGRYRPQHSREVFAGGDQCDALRHEVNHALPVRRIIIHRRRGDSPERPPLRSGRADDRPDVPETDGCIKSRRDTGLDDRRGLASAIAFAPLSLPFQLD